MAATRKEEIITFKVDRELVDRMKGIRNRSEFIRAAILAAMENVCPLCTGTGVLTVRQADYWSSFMQRHHIEVAEREARLVCDAGRKHAH